MCCLDEAENEWIGGIPNDQDCIKFANVHLIINAILKIVPMSRDILFQSLISTYPYIKKPAHLHEVYVHNILWTLDYVPELRQDCLNLIFNRYLTHLIAFDINNINFCVLD